MDKDKKFDIVEFYSRISTILERYRENHMHYDNAVKGINELNELAKSFKIDVFVDSTILNDLSVFDDERSYVEEDYSYESSYDDN
jgi:hypothetical protein